MSHWSLTPPKNSVNVNCILGIPSKGQRHWYTYILSPSVTGDCVNSLARASAARQSPRSRMLPLRSQAVGIDHICYGVLIHSELPYRNPQTG